MFYPTPSCSIVPPYLLRRLAAQQKPELSRAAHGAKQALQHVPSFQASRTVPGPGSRPGLRELKPSPPERTVYDAKSTEKLPGSVVRKEGEPPTGDPAADEAYDGLGHTHRLYAEAFGRNSIDGKGLHLDATVHYGRLYDNAFWDGQQMVFGDGDGQVFERFTKSLSVIGHELTHGVTQYTAGLQYTDQPGALNEATSDIFGACIDARVNGKDAGTFNWLIGEDVMAPQLYGEAIRSMAYPGTAYDDPILGTDPQPATMAGYVPGGDPHVNSGIINRWFYLMATDLGMNDAAVIWYATLQNLWPTAQFADAAHVAAAQARILARDGKVSSRAPQTVRGTARAQGII